MRLFAEIFGREDEVLGHDGEFVEDEVMRWLDFGDEEFFGGVVEGVEDFFGGVWDGEGSGGFARQGWGEAELELWAKELEEKC